MPRNGLTAEQLKSMSAGDVILVSFKLIRRKDVPCMLLPYQHPLYLNLAVPSPNGAGVSAKEMPYDSLGRDWTAIPRTGADN